MPHSTPHAPHDMDVVRKRWREYLEDAPPPAFPRRQNRDPDAAPAPGALLRRKMALPKGLSTEVSAAVVQIAWCLVNVYYSDADDVVIGLVPMDDEDESDDDDDNRHDAPTAAATPFRFSMQPDQTITSCLDAVLHHELAEAPFKNIALEDLAQLGSDVRNATMFDNQLIILDSGADSDINLNRALNVECTIARSRITVQAFYDDAIISRTEMQRVLGTFDHLFQQLADARKNKKKTLGDINPISADDLGQVSRWNEQLPPAVNDCMHYIVERMAEERPSAEAVSSQASGVSWSYEQLNAMSDKLAHHLVSKGVKPGHIVPFMFEKNPWVIPSMLAINKAGGAFVPLDPAHQWKDTQGLLLACEATFVVCSPTHHKRFQDNGIDAVVIEPSTFDALPSLGPVSAHKARPTDPGYAIFTSGSTGTPKGIICSHSAWCTNTTAHGPREFHSVETRLLQFSAYTFDISITDTFTTLAFGGTVCVPTEHERINDLAGAMNRMRVNHAALTPTVAQFLTPETVPTLEVLVTGGESMPEAIFSLWAGKIRLINSYGPAECTSRVSCSLKSPGDNATDIGTNVGAALWVTRSNDPSSLVPIGAIGELLVEGNVLADGYLKDEQKTKEAFIDAPEWLKNAYPERAHNKRLYRTGDLVRQEPGGSFVFVGRRDTQIKVHGVRLEAGHIEAKIKQELPKDAGLVVDKIMVGDGDRPKQTLAAFITLPDLMPSSREAQAGPLDLLPLNAKLQEFIFDLRKTLLASLPSYMVPSHLLVVNKIPLGATGKVNRRALQAFARNLPVERLNQFTGAALSNSGANGAIEKPETDTEIALSKIWAQILGVPPTAIGRQDNFFGLGGDSVSSMKLVAEAAEVGLHFSVADIFQYSTMAELGQFLDGPDAGAELMELEPIEPFELIGGPTKFLSLREQLRKMYKIAANRVEDVYPATAMQEGLMAETVSAPEAYILQEVLKLSRQVDEDRLQSALEVLIETHPILRTRIVRLRNLGTCQVVMSDDELEPAELESDMDLQSFLAEDKQSHMGFGDALSRFTIVEEPRSGNRYLVWTCHHAITDGHMHQLMLRDLELAYNNEQLDEPKTDFSQFIKLQTDPDNVDEAMNYWKTQFAGSEAMHYPPCPDMYEPSITDYVTRQVSLPQNSSRLLFTPSILLRASWMIVITQASNSGDSELVMGITQSGRDIALPGVHECMGPCLATIPARVAVDLAAPLSFSQYLGKVQQQYIDAIPHQHIGLQHIRKASDECADAVGFRNLLVVQPPTVSSSKLFTPDDETRNAGDQLNFGLLLECVLSGKGDVTIRAGFDRKLLSAEEATLLVHRLEHVYRQLSNAGNANRPLSQVDIVSPMDMRTLESFNPDVSTLEQCMHWMIEEQARRQPAALMVDSWDARLTYKEANEYSDRLAGTLVTLGVGPEVMVPFAFEKSAWATIAIHAILKAGGVCVALDMAHPRERHQTIVADTGAHVIVASSQYVGNLQGLGSRTQHLQVVGVDRPMLDQLPPRPPHTKVPVKPSNAAWVVYSSGSTGVPKGSILEHRSLCSTSRTNSEILGVGPSTRAIHFASYSFDVAIEENVIIPMCGGCVCIPSDEDRLNDLPGVMRSMQINWADLTPTVGRMLNPENAPFLRTLVLGGESLTKDIIDTWGDISNFKLFNTYGPSECSIQCTSSKPLARVATGANIGRAVNCKLWVVDANDPARLLPAGATGELLIEGPIVGRGYLNQAAKTKAAFIEGLPWAVTPGSTPRRFYRTGDLAKFNPDGTLDCLGRQDSQIKLHGQRIELGEIEYNIKKQLVVPDAAQIAVEAFTPGTSSSRKLLAAFIQFSAPPPGTTGATKMVVMEMTDALRTELLRIKSETGKRLPEYMVPTLFVPLITIAMNTSGKIDRKKLREEAAKFDQKHLALYSLSQKAQAQVEAKAASTATTTTTTVESSTEDILASLWAETLGIDLNQDPIGSEDSFLELGGDSITAMQLVGKARASGLALSVPRIMRAPKLKDMALAATRVEGTELSLPARPKAAAHATAPVATPVAPPTATSRSSTEQILTGLWAETLGIDLDQDPIGSEDSFLELGGDSITAMQLVGKARASGIALSVPRIMRAPRLRDMALAATRVDEAPQAAPAPQPLAPPTPVVASAPVAPAPAPPVYAAPTPAFAPAPATPAYVAPAPVAPAPVAAPAPVVPAPAPPAPVAPAPALTKPESTVRTAPSPETALEGAYYPFQLVENKVAKSDIMAVLADKYKINPGTVLDVYPATPLQEGMIALTSTSSNSYVLRDTYELPTNIDLDRFKAAWDAVARSNHILTTRVVFVEGLGSCQVVVDEKINWQHSDDLDDYLSKDRSEPMDYGTPLARYAIVYDGKGKKTFVWTVHHALYDGYSIGLVFAAVDNAYQGNLGDFPTRPFVDFIRYLDQVDKESLTGFWTDQLKDLETSPFPLPPTGHLCQADNTVSYSVPFSIDRTSGITMATLLKAAWSILISRLSESPDVIYGVTQSGRDLELPDIEIMNGPTITTVPLRVRVEEQTSVRDFLKQLQSQTLDMIPFSHVGLQNIKKLSDAARAACDFQNLLVIQPAEQEEESVLFQKHTTATSASYLSGYGLVVECALDKGEISCSAHHDSTVISAPQVERLLQQLEHLLHQLQAFNGNGRIIDVDMFSPPDRADLVAWNSNYPKVVKECMHDIISRNAAANPTATAIASRSGNISYKELDELSDHLAHQLRDLGVGPDKLVPIGMEKSPDAIVAMIAIQKAGGGFVPLNPTDPTDRLLDLLDQVSATVVIFSEQTKHLQTALVTNNTKNRISAVVLPKSLAEWGPLITGRVESGVKPSHLAYALFTSGSTGRPKAVMIEHVTVCSSTYGHGVAMGFADYPRRTVQFASYTFDACIAEIFTALHFNGCICVPTEHERMNDLTKFIRDFECDWAFFTPSFVRLMKPEDMPSMKTVVLGGEALNQECIDVWGDKVHLMNGYGPTETCVFAVTRTVPGPLRLQQSDVDGERRHKAETIGHPVSAIGWVVDPNNHNRLTPVGCVGELILQGPSVARGYLGDPEKTAASFVQSPKWLRAFGHYGPATLYKSGDLVRQDVVDGTLTYLGRKDNQTKVNGQRLELGEIETQLKAKGSKVESAVVLATGADKTKQKLAAFIQFSDLTSSGTSIMKIDDAMLARLQDLERGVRATLPNYMVPSYWLPVTNTPIFPASGKTDRKTLAALLKGLDATQLPAYTLGAPDDDDLEPGEKQEAANDLEKTLTELVARVLGLDPANIGRQDSFFRLGGDSITAMQLVAAARTVSITLSTEVIFRQPRLCDMATNAELARGSGAGVQTAKAPLISPFSLVPYGKCDELLAMVEKQYSIEKSSILDMMPCTPLQEGMITLTIEDADAYVLREIYRLPGKIDMDRFKSAWEIVVKQAELLRSRIVHLGEHGCFQVVLDQPGIEWLGASKVQEYIDYDKKQLFCYGAPLARFALVETEYTGSYFILSMHHSVYDGWSKQLIMKHVQEAYQSLASPESSAVEVTIPPYNRFIDYLQKTDAEETKKFWQAQFENLEAQAFPRTPSSTFKPILDGTMTIKVPFVRKPSSPWTTATVLKAAWALLLVRYTGAGDALFGVVQTGRNAPVQGISDMLGPTITTVPLRVRVDGDMPLTTFLDGLQDQSTNMIKYEHTGLQNIAKMGNDCRDACGFSNIMVIQPGQVGAQGESDLDQIGAQRIEDQDKGSLRFGMGLECTLDDGAILLTGGYDVRLMSEAEMQRLLRQLKAAILDINRDYEDVEGTLVKDVNLVAAEDMAEMAEMNEIEPDDIYECTHDVIHRMALERGSHMAVNAWDIDFQYFELDQLSTKLAHRLQSLGVGPESIVPLCFEKSGWGVVAVLGVMKAGGAFVFLDPGYPMARLNGIVQQVEAKVILASLGQAPLWRGSSVPVLVVDNVSIESLPSVSYEDVRESKTVTPSNSLYVIFTSGSTGNPKGCVVEHHSFLTCARAQATRSYMSASSRVLQGASYSFDVSVMEMLTALTVGACICVPNESIKKRSVTDVINDFRITWAFLTPSLVKFIKPSDTPHLKTLILGGEALTRQNIQTWAGHLRLLNGYGPSECTIAASAHAITSPDEDPANIGKALGGICWITDPEDHNKLAPLGAIGELIVEGSIVARGYLNNPAKTAEVFFEDPVWAKPASSDNPKPRRMYKTGDLASFSTNGDIMFVGRKDAQVKVRGQRMELGEIETHLTLNKKIQHAIVAYPKTGPCKRQLVGIVSFAELGATTNSNNEVVLVDPDLTETVSAEVADMAKKLGAVVPAYMIPEVWVVVTSFPLLLSGKLNRKRVEQWLGSMDKATHQRICGMGESFRVQPPSTEGEVMIHKVWVEVLKLPAEEVGVTQEFSTLGGDSILAMLVVAKLKAQGLRITMTDVISARTISALASRVGGTGGISGGAVQLGGQVKAATEIINEPFDLTPIQQFYANFTLKTDYLSKQTNKRFNHTFCLTVKKAPLAAAVIKEAIEALVNRHGMLRARFQRDETAACGWRQYISTDTDGSYRFHSWDDVTVEQVKPAIEQARTGLDIENGPLVAVDLVTVSDDEQYLMIVAHHLVVDLVSWNTILADLEDYLTSKTFTSETPYPFSAWAREQKQHAIDHFAPDKVLPLRSRIFPANFEYWDMENRINIIRDAEHHTVVLSVRDTTTLLTTCNKALGAEPMDILCSALTHSFSYVFRDRAPPTMFRYNHGREAINDADPSSGTVGWFTTFSPIHVAIRSRDDSLTVLQRTIKARKTLLMNGLGYFASRYHHPAGAAAFSAFDKMEVNINYLGIADNQRQQSGESSKFFDMSNAVANGLGAEGQEVKGFSLFSISAEVKEGRLGINCTWNKKMSRQGAIQKWFMEYENALKDIAHQARKLDRLSMKSAGGAGSGANRLSSNRLAPPRHSR